MSKPNVSVIIPCSRPEQVKSTLARLVQQTCPIESIEIILVGSGCSALLAEYPVRIIALEALVTPGMSRNLGVRAAGSEYLLFLDDDCEPALNWVEANLSALQDPAVGAVGGQIAGKARTFFARCVDFSRFGFAQGLTARETWVCSASLGVKREAFEAAGGFNEHLRSEEDIDFCFRLRQRGYKTIYQPAIKVLHDHRRRTFGELLRYSYFYGRVSGLYVKRLYAGFSRRNKILTAIQHPWLYPWMICPVALGATLNLVRVNVRTYPQVLLYAPFILLSKIASHVGIWFWLLQNARQ